MSFKNNPGAELIKQAFEEFFAKYNKQDMTDKSRKAISEIARSFTDAARKSGKLDKNALFDALETQLSAQDVETFVSDVYALISGPKTSEGLSLLAQSLDLSQVEIGLQKVVDNLKDPAKNQQLAQSIKQLAATGGAEQLKAQIKGSLSKSNMPPIVASLIGVNIDRFADFVSSSKDMSVAEISNYITAFADSVPVGTVSSAVYMLTANLTPETVSNMSKQATANLPSPQAVAAMYTMALQNGRDGLPKSGPTSNDNKDDKTPKRAPGKDFKFKGFDKK